MFYVCDLVGGSATTSAETSEVGWFAEDAVPQDLSLGRVLPHQLLSDVARTVEVATGPIDG